MLPGALVDGLFANDLDGVVGPGGNDVGTKAAVFKPKVPTPVPGSRLHFGENGTIGNAPWNKDPSSEGEFLIPFKIAHIGKGNTPGFGKRQFF